MAPARMKVGFEGPSTFQVGESFAKSFYGLFNNFFPVDENGQMAKAAGPETFFVGSEAPCPNQFAKVTDRKASLQLTPEEIANMTVSKGAERSRMLPLQVIDDTMGSARRPKDSFDIGRKDALASSRQSALPQPPPCMPAHAHAAHASPPTDKMTPYGPAPCTVPVDSRVANAPAIAMQGPPVTTMTPYGPAPCLESFDGHAWAQEKEQHKMLMQRQQEAQQRSLQQHRQSQLEQQRKLEQERQRQLQQAKQLEQQLQQLQRQDSSLSMQQHPSLCSTNSIQHQQHSHSQYSCEGVVNETPVPNGHLLDQHVEYYLSCHPGVRESRRIRKKRDGCYEINGREVVLDWEHHDPNGGEGYLVVVDGPLRQAFRDYVSGKDTGAVYNNHGLRQSNLHMVATDCRITFQDQGTTYNRLEAMKVAKEQAVYREKAAHCVNLGQTVPSDLFEEYETVLDGKLGKSRQEYENAKKRWSKKAQQDGPPKLYPSNAPPGMCESQLVTEGYKERYGRP